MHERCAESGSSDLPSGREPADSALALTRRSLLAITLAGLSATAHADQGFPRSPVTFVVPYTPGSGNDVIGRIIAAKLPTFLDQRVIVENRSGAGGTIGIEFVRRASPNGYTLLVASLSFSIDRYAMDATYEAADFTPIAMVGSLPFTLIVNKSIPANNMKELVDLIRANPGKFSVGEGGVIGSNYFLFESFKKAAGLDFISVPYSGSSAAMIDFLAGRVQMMAAPISTGMPYIQSGDAKIVGVTGAKRTALLPDVPTFTEQGFPSMNISSWYALLGARGIPDDAVQILSEAISKVMVLPEVIASCNKLGITPGYAPPSELGPFLKADMANWKKRVEEAGLSATKH